MDKKDIKKLQRQFNRANNPPQREQIPFNPQLNFDDPNPLFPHKSNRQFLKAHISDNAMRNILHLALVDLGMEGCSNEELCEFLVENDIWDETQASLFVLDYIASKEVE